MTCRCGTCRLCKKRVSNRNSKLRSLGFDVPYILEPKTKRNYLPQTFEDALAMYDHQHGQKLLLWPPIQDSMRDLDEFPHLRGIGKDSLSA